MGRGPDRAVGVLPGEKACDRGDGVDPVCIFSIQEWDRGEECPGESWCTCGI